MFNYDSENKYLGVTAPISLNFPTEIDKELTKSMIEALKECGLFESEEESLQREIVLGKLNVLVKDFVVEMGMRQNMTEAEAKLTSGKIFTFGSYRLGVHHSGADIDTLCVVPYHVERNDFFTIFFQQLQAHNEITELTQVPDAYVPVIKMKFSGIAIDLVFARLNLQTIPDDLDLLDHNLLKNLDEKCILSLNGSRVTDEILRLVPNISSFHTALRCIKYWAKRRALYSNVMGYLGGVAYAMLVARICQLYPNASGFTIVQRFFKIYSQWKWPQPVFLKSLEDFPLGMKIWNPKIYQADRYHKMPIITPAYPSMCSTHNVLNSTLTIMTAEFTRGTELMVKIEEKKALWANLFAKSDFFFRYKHYFQILACCDDVNESRVWSGFVESKVRTLSKSLEMIPNIEVAPPFSESFDLKVEAHSLDEAVKKHVFNDLLEKTETVDDKAEEANTENDSEVKKFFYTTAFYIGISVKAMTGIYCVK